MGDKADVVINCIESCTNLLKLYFKKSQGSWSLTLFGNVLSFFFLAITRQREKRNHLRRTGASYEADKETLKRLIPLDGSSPPPPLPKTDAGNNGDAATDSPSQEQADKPPELRHCLLPGCALRERSGTSGLQCNTLLHVKSYWGKTRQRMRDIISHSTFDVVIVLLILLNTIVLALYYHGIHLEYRHILDYVNLVSDNTLFVHCSKGGQLYPFFNRLYSKHKTVTWNLFVHLQ